MKQLIKTCYIPSRPDVLFTTYRTESGEKITAAIASPHMRFFVSKPEHWDPDKIIKSSRPIEELQEYRAPYRDILRHVAALTGRTAELSLAGGRARFLHHTNNVLCSDFNIEDVAIDDFLIDNDWMQAPNKLKIRMFDIETDNINHVGFPDANEAPCPINMITYGSESEIYAFCNIDGNVALQELALNSGSLEKVYADTQQKMFEISGFQTKLTIQFCATEVEMLYAWINQVKLDNPDYVGAWNARFDICTIAGRCARLGINPSDFFGNTDYPGWWFFKLDEDAEKPEDRIDTFETPTPWTYVDSQTVFAQLRKNANKFDSYKLDDIAELFLKKKKIDISQYGRGVSINNLAHKAPAGFITYSVIDTFILTMLNLKLKDIESLHLLSLVTRTRFNATFYKTVIIRNFYKVMLRDVHGRILSNNWNSENEGKAEFRGGFVADPRKNCYEGVNLGGMTRSNFIFDNVVDMDFASMYPSIIRAWNISDETLIGFITDQNGNMDVAARLIDLLSTGDVISLIREFGGVDPLTHFTRVKKYGEQWLLARGRSGDNVCA